MSLFKRKGSPHWYTEIQVRGRRVCRSTGTCTRRTAEAFEKQLREETRREAERVGPSPGTRLKRASIDYTVDQMFGRYWLEHASKLRWATDVASYGKRIVNLIGHIRIADLTEVDIADMVETMRDAGTGQVALNRAISVLRGAHTMACKRWGCATQTIHWRMLRSKEPKERIRWLTKDEACRLLSCLPPHTSLIVEWSLYTGLRKAESLSLTWEAVDYARGTVDVTVKGGHKRQILLSDAARSVLERAPKRSRYVFDRTNLRKHFVAGLAAADITNFRFHDLRHTNATWMRQEGASLEVIQRSLGHSSIQVTQRYAHVDDQEVLAASNAIGTLSPSNVVRFRKVAKSQFVYFVSDGEAVKIGRSADPERRLKAIQTHHPKPLWLLGTVSTRLLTEQEAHSRFAGHRRLGEWFDGSEAVLKEIQKLCGDAKSPHVGTMAPGLTVK
jgi:integrase